MTHGDIAGTAGIADTADTADRDQAIAAPRTGRASVWLACGAAVLAASGGALAGAGVHPVRPETSPDRSVQAFIGDQRLGSRVVDWVALSQDPYPAPQPIAWVTADDRHCAGAVLPARASDSYSSISGCADLDTTALAHGGRGLVALSGFVWNGDPASAKDGHRATTHYLFALVRDAARVTATWNGRPLAVRLVAFPAPGDPDLGVILLESPTSTEPLRSYSIVAYDASGVVVGKSGLGGA